MNKLIQKKFLLWLFVCSFFLNACSRGQSTALKEEEQLQLYQSYLTAMETNTEYNQPEYFNIEVIVNQLSDNEYRYDVVVDEPRIAMYKVQVLCVERDVTGTLLTQATCPSAGIFEDAVYNLLPNQVNKDKGYPAGVIVSGISANPETVLDVLVVWNGYARLAENRQYFQLKAVYDPNAVTESNEESSGD